MKTMLSASQKQFGTLTGFDLLDCCAFRIIEYLQSCHNVVDDGSDLIFATDRSRSKNAGGYYVSNTRIRSHIEWQVRTSRLATKCHAKDPTAKRPVSHVSRLPSGGGRGTSPSQDYPCFCPLQAHWATS